MNLLNKAYLANDIRVKNCIKNAIRNVESVDFNKANEAVMLINGDVSRATKGKINTLVQPHDMNMARFLLLNAIYFKGTWKTKFIPTLTHQKPFFNENGENSGTVNLMVLPNEKMKHG